MLVVFLDGTNTPEPTGWFVLGGIVVLDKNLLELESEFKATLRNSGVPVDQPGLDLEVKWSPKKGNWLRDNLDSEARKKLYRDLLTTAFGLGCRAVGAILNWGAMTHRSSGRRYDEARARDFAYELVLERIQAYARELDEIALVICDCEEEQRRTRDRVRRTGELVRVGSAYVALDRIYKHVWPADSRDHVGIQIADLCVGVLGSLAVGKARYARDYWDRLQRNFVVLEAKQTPQDWGLAILPSPLRRRFLKEWAPYG